MSKLKPYSDLHEPFGGLSKNSIFTSTIRQIENHYKIGYAFLDIKATEAFPGRLETKSISMENSTTTWLSLQWKLVNIKRITEKTTDTLRILYKKLWKGFSLRFLKNIMI